MGQKERESIIESLENNFESFKQDMIQQSSQQEWTDWYSSRNRPLVMEELKNKFSNTSATGSVDVTVDEDEAESVLTSMVIHGDSSHLEHQIISELRTVV